MNSDYYSGVAELTMSSDEFSGETKNMNLSDIFPKRKLTLSSKLKNVKINNHTKSTHQIYKTSL
jgi:hypothetical protein